MKFKSLKQYHDLLKVQVVVSILVGSYYGAQEGQWLVSLIMFSYSLFCAYLWLFYMPSIDPNEVRRTTE